MTDVFWPGLVAVAVLYAAVFAVGAIAGRSRGEQPDDAAVDELLLAGRSLPLWVGLLTMTATWVGGGYINGTAERTFSDGLLWGAQAGLGYSLSLLVGGLVYARTMRRHGFTTLVDPLESRYGRHTAALLMIPAVFAEVCWSGAILVALGTTFGTVLGVPLGPSIFVSATIAIAYTMLGGLRAVAYTDVIQLALIFVGLGLAVPFVLVSAGGVAALTAAATAPTPDWREALVWSDWTVLLILGGIPWNVYFQRVLSARDEDAAAWLSIASGGLCLLAAIPPLLLGLAGTQIDWVAVTNAAGGDGARVASDLAQTPALVLPYLLRWAVPLWVGVIGLGAISAAVMSSVDSSILSAASLLVWNGWRRLIEPDVTARKVTLLVRAAIVLLGALATTLALTVSSVAALWYLCGDIVYCVLFPQLTLALFDTRANRIGAQSGLFVSAGLRLACGEPTLGIPAMMPLPDWEHGFPFRTACMVAGLLTTLVVSRLTASIAPPVPLGAPAR